MLSYSIHQKGVPIAGLSGVRDPDTPVALFASRVSPEKNLTLLSQAFKKMQQLNPDTRCVIVGDGPSYQAIQKRKPKRDLLPL